MIPIVASLKHKSSFTATEGRQSFLKKGKSQARYFSNTKSVRNIKGAFLEAKASEHGVSKINS